VNYRITDCNTAYTKITGICRADAVGKLANEVFGTLEPLSLDVFTRVGVSGEPYHYETYFAPLNKYFAISVVSPGKNRFATITTDITERRAAEAEVRPLNEELEERVAKRTAELEQSVELLRATQAELVESEKMAALSHLVVGVAHELNTPIGTSLTASSYLDQQVEQLERQIAAGTLTHNQFTDATQTLRKAATLNQTSLQRAARLVGFFKEMAVSMEAEAPVPIGLRALVDSAFHNLTRQRTTGLPHLENHIAPALTVITRTVPLSRVLAKILENATDHAFEGRAPGTVTVSAITNDGWVELHVCDDGSGIPENDWKKVFEPFYTTKRGAGHVGLGLSIAFNLVIHLLGGTIQCQSGSDGGACFNIRFPTD
jgi:C4-dicarboxylate-specific signal transduction histidine kinase